MKINNQSGWTLIELLVSLVIFSIPFLWSNHYWKKYKDRIELIKTAEEIIYFIGKVQLKSGYLNKELYLWINNGDDWCILLSVNHANCNEVSNNLKIGNNSIKLISSTTSKLIFWGRRNTAFPASFILENEQGKIKIVISNHGRVRQCALSLLSRIAPC